MIASKLGAYEIREEIDRGGAAIVYRAYQPYVDRDVAIKVILKTLARDSQAVQRFQREARLIARLEHPHILPVYDFDGRHAPPYIVMRYLDCGSLEEVLTHQRLPIEETSRLVQQVASALDYAHRQGIVHRDVKPSNVLIDCEGNAFVTDFGLALMIAGVDTNEQATAAGAIAGTPHYMSPEQARDPTNVDHRADIYALGVILFEMLTGELPYVADNAMNMLMMHIQAPIPSAVQRNPELPAPVDEIIARALAKDPAERYSSAAALAEAVGSVFGDTSGSSSTRLQTAAQTVSALPRIRAASRKDPGAEIIGKQQKTVTALYANAAEYAEIVDEIGGGEAVHKALGALWDAARRIIQAHGGLVLSRTGVTLMALWGTDTAREDDAEQAIRAALELQAALGLRAALQQQSVAFLDGNHGGEALLLDVGIHTGLALLSPDTQNGEYSASGATISLTNRLAQQAQGGVLISHDTYSQVRGVFEVELDTPLRLRGRRESLPVYRVTGAKPRTFWMNTRGVEGVETRMVGREAELIQLRNGFLDAVEQRRTRAVTVISQPGLGKSRLLYEFINWTELRREQFWLMQGRASPEMARQPYALLRDLLSFHLDIRDSDSPGKVQEKLERGMVEQIGPDEEMAHLLGHLAGFDMSSSPFLKGLQSDPQQLANRTKQLFVRWVMRLCAVAPVIIELEDLHNADDASLDLLNGLVTEHDDLPLLLVRLARPLLYERRPAWGTGQPFHTLLELHPLNKTDSRALVREILQKVDDLPEALHDLLVERAEGNPYYMEELVRMLIDDRVIIRDGDPVWRVEASWLEHLEVPTTLVGLLQARLDNLLYPEKLTLQRAAAVGRIFYDSAVEALDAADEVHLEDLPGILRWLEEREFIFRCETTAFEGSTEYSFANNMLHSVLESTLLRRERETYYRAAATWLMEVSGERADEYSGRLAHYCERAGETEAAARYLQRAGEKALGISAFGEAREMFDRALAFLPETASTRSSLQLRLGEACFELGDYPAARETLEAARDLARSQDDGPRTADALYWLGRVAISAGDFAQAQGYLGASLPLARAGDDSASMARVLYGLGGLHWSLGSFDKARVVLKESLALTRQVDDAHQELHALTLLGSVAMNQGDWDEAQQLLEEAHARARQVGNRERATIALNNLGVLAGNRGDTAAAQNHYQQALSMARETGNQQSIALLLINLAETFILLDHLKAARQHLHEGLAVALRIGVVPNVLLAVHNAGWLLAKQGDTQQGLALLGLALYHPAADSKNKRNVHEKLDDLGMQPDDPQVDAGLAVGKDLDLAETVAELLKELSDTVG